MNADNVCRPEVITDILNTGEVQIFFQPLVAVDTRRVVGFEAYARGIMSQGNDVISPQALFGACVDIDQQLAIDRLCRESALEKFKGIYTQHAGILLFLNFNIDILDSKNVDLDALFNLITGKGYKPRHVVIEMEASKINAEKHTEFLLHHRQKGFKFSLDDLENLDLELMHLVRPDFIKIGRNGYADLADNTLHKNVLNTIRKVALDFGCQLAAKGIESEEEAFLLLDNKIYLQQGFFFTKKEIDTGQDASQIFQETMQEVHLRYKDRTAQSIKAHKARLEGYNQILARALAKFEKTTRREYGDTTRNLMRNYQECRTIFVLDEKGREVGGYFTKTPDNEGKMSLQELHSETDHSIQDYFLYLQTGFERFVTKPFTSPITKERHCLMSRRFFNVEGQLYVLCVEFPYQNDTD
ncbi:MAG: EAL domain-containing protein [Desulfovibrionaceae bacterium]